MIDVEPVTIVYIEPHTRHRAWSEQEANHRFDVPAYRPDDECCVTDP